MLLPQEHIVVVRQIPKWGQILLLSLLGLGAVSLTIGWFHRIDEIITVRGRLVSQQGSVDVKSPISGQLAAVLVTNGEQVTKGEALLRFDLGEAKFEERALSQQLQLEQRRIKDQLQSNNQRQKTLKRNIGLTKRILDKLNILENSGAISEVQTLQQANRLEIQKDELIQLQTRRRELINNSRSRSAALQGRLNQVRNQLRNELIKAPIDGTVFDLAANNNRYVAVNAEPLMKIVPEGQLNGIVNVGNKDIGFIQPGQMVKVRIDSFPYTEYGEIDGFINRISADALPPNQLIGQYHFPVDLRLKTSQLITNQGTAITLQSGMTITANLKLRDRRLIELLSDLFVDRSESLKRLRKP